MGTKQVIIRFCDACGKELTGRLTYRTCPICGKDVCLSCIEKENAKHKPRERKQKVEQTLGETFASPVSVIYDIKRIHRPAEVSPELREMEDGLNAEGLTLVQETEPKKRGKPPKNKPTEVIEITKPDLSTFTIKTPESGSKEPYTLSLGEASISSMTLKEGITELLAVLGITREDIEFTPESDGKKLLLGVLNGIDN